MIKKIKPQRSVLHVSALKVVDLAPEDISINEVGHKAIGLAALPQVWTPPFVTVAAECYQSFRENANGQGESMSKWVTRIREALQIVGIAERDSIIVRSSGCSEELSKRGRFYSAIGTTVELARTMSDCLRQLSKDRQANRERMPLIIQKYCTPVSKGHLSNERRCYEESRDWLGEFETAIPTESSRFQINIRNWRHDSKSQFNLPLSCLVSPRISEILKIPAKWATQKQARVHFEWTWDGQCIFVVQADEETVTGGHNPITEHQKRRYNSVVFAPRCLRLVNQQDGLKFKKVANARIYSKLGLPTAPLYILDDQEVIRNLSREIIAPDLYLDLSNLVKGSLIIRTDLATQKLADKQLLPRTDEIRTVSKGISWLVKQTQLLNDSTEEYAFIFHNFIPAQAAAFAFAHPSNPFVQIESLWGLPEGLYYNAHDKYLVDTDKANISSVHAGMVETFKVKEKRSFKRVFVSTTKTGKWETLHLAPPYDWKGSLSHATCRYIAYQSRRIATEEKKSVSIMWFVGTPANIAGTPAIPWYHEEFDLTLGKPSMATKTKTSFDKYFVIESVKDLTRLSRMSATDARLTRIKIQPTDEKLLRDKNTLWKIGEVAKNVNAILVLEGAVLSHAYYQLLSTGANVEVLNPFIGFEQRHVFNKLVRDYVPNSIQERGETIKIAKLNQEALVLALREKLVEEAYETLDAKDLESIKAEIVDIREVVDALAKHLDIPESELRFQQTQKRTTRGGFDEGIVLLETQSVPPSQGIPIQNQMLLSGLQPNNDAVTLDETSLRRLAETITKWSDRRVTKDNVETKIRIIVPTIKGSWLAKTNEEKIETKAGEGDVLGIMKGDRSGSQWTIELTVRIQIKQPELL